MTNPEVCRSTDSFWQPTDLVSTLLSRGARDVVWYWISQKRFLDDNNQPRSLAIGGLEDTDFNSLISMVSPNLAPAVICNELLRKGIVEKYDNGCLLLRRSAYVQGAASFEDRLPVFEEPMVSVGNHGRRRNDLI